MRNTSCILETALKQPNARTKVEAWYFSEILLLPGILGFPIPTLFFWKINGWNPKFMKWIESGIFGFQFRVFFKFKPWIFGAVSLGKSTRNPSNNLWRGLVYSKQAVVLIRALRIKGSQNWWFGDPRTLLYRVKPLHGRIPWFLGSV